MPSPGKNRSRHLPDVPTMTELGYPDIQFQALGRLRSAPASCRPTCWRSSRPPSRRQRAAPAVQQKLIDVGLEPDVSVDTPALLGETKAMSERNAAIVRKFNIQAN